MDYFQALKQKDQETTASNRVQQHVQLPPAPKSSENKKVVEWLKEMTAPLWYPSEGEEPINSFYISRDSLRGFIKDTDEPLPTPENLVKVMSLGVEDPSKEVREISYESFFENLNVILECMGTPDTQSGQSNKVADITSRIGVLSEWFKTIHESSGIEPRCFKVGAIGEIQVFLIAVVNGDWVGLETTSVET